MKSARVFLFVSLFSILLAAGSARAQEVLLNADAQINSASPSTNYGAAQTLAVNSTTSTILRYDLTDILPTGVTSSQVSKARLIIFPDTVTTKGNFNVFALTSSFAENTVTYATRPTIGATPAVTATISGAFEPIQIQLTSTVQGWLKDTHGLYNWMFPPDVEVQIPLALNPAGQSALKSPPRSAAVKTVAVADEVGVSKRCPW